jgi:RNA polymerase sigma factor (sigma-70 family)
MQVDDMDLVQQFARSNADEAFAALVRRHINLVYSVALRQLGNAQDAEEVTQAVFIVLARKAASLRSGTILSGWLYQTARLTAANFQRATFRRLHREQEAFMQFAENSDPDVSWQRLSPLLEEAMSRLGPKERDAVVLRFFENRTVREVASALGLEEAAAQKRVNRATDKLRAFFTRRGVQVSTVALLASIGTHAVQAAPEESTAKLAAMTALKGTTVGSSTLTLIKTTLKIMTWTKAKTAIVIGVIVLLAAATTTITVKEIQAHRTYPWQVLAGGISDKQVNQPPQVRILHSKFQEPDWATLA